MDRPYLLEPNGNDNYVVAVSSATEARFYNLMNGVYVPEFFVQDQLTHDSQRAHQPSLQRSLRPGRQASPQCRQRGCESVGYPEPSRTPHHEGRGYQYRGAQPG